MNKNINKRILSSILAFMMVFLPIIGFASNNIDISYIQKENTEEVLIKILGERERQASISIKDDDRYYYFDQKKLDENGRLELNTKLPLDKEYDVLVNIDGNQKSIKLEMKGKSTENPEIPVEKKKASISIKGYKGNIISGNYDIVPGESVLDFTKRILDSKNISYSDKKGYISSIDGQSEFDKGPDSGWMYSVNGKFLNDGAGDVKINPGDRVEWKYTYDLGIDLGVDSSDWNIPSIDKDLEGLKDLNKAVKEKIGTNDFKDKKDMIDTVNKSIKLNRELDDLNKSGKKEKVNRIEMKSDDKIVIKKDLMDVLKNKEVEDISIESKGIRINLNPYFIDIKNDLEIVIKNDKDLLVEMKKDGKSIDRLDKSIKIELPIKDMKNPENLVVIDENGNVIGGLYNKKNNTIIFTSKELGRFSLEARNKTFEDIKKHWAENQIEDLASKGIINGISEDRFNPDGDITRAEFTSLISRMMKYTKDDFKDSKYKDISLESWYANDILSVTELGIVNGKSDNTFDPEGNITREEMVKIVGNLLYLESFKKSSEAELDKYNDKELIANWAKEGASISTKHGVVKGDNTNNFNPKENATRAEASMMIYRLYELVLFN